MRQALRDRGNEDELLLNATAFNDFTDRENPTCVRVLMKLAALPWSLVLDLLRDELLEELNWPGVRGITKISSRYVK